VRQYSPRRRLRGSPAGPPAKKLTAAERSLSDCTARTAVLAACPAPPLAPGGTVSSEKCSVLTSTPQIVSAESLGESRGSPSAAAAPSASHRALLLSSAAAASASASASASAAIGRCRPSAADVSWRPPSEPCATPAGAAMHVRASGRPAAPRSLSGLTAESARPATADGDEPTLTFDELQPAHAACNVATKQKRATNENRAACNVEHATQRLPVRRRMVTRRRWRAVGWDWAAGEYSEYLADA
jgi:hypothetical protein